jgi:hypothetical protein
LKSEVSSPLKLWEKGAGGALCAHPEGTPPPVKMIATIADGKNARFSIGECLLARSALKTIAAGVDGASGLRS